jgi:hypothetical protein
MGADGSEKHAPLERAGRVLANHFTMRKRSPPPGRGGRSYLEWPVVWKLLS